MFCQKRYNCQMPHIHPVLFRHQSNKEILGKCPFKLKLKKVPLFKFSEIVKIYRNRNLGYW
jgi:hypothetical protein